MKRHKLLRPGERVPELPTTLWRVRPVRGAIVYTDGGEPLPDGWSWVPVSPHLAQAIKRGDLERDGVKIVKRAGNTIEETILKAPGSGSKQSAVIRTTAIEPAIRDGIPDERNAVPSRPEAAKPVTPSGEPAAPPPFAHTPGTRRTPEQNKAMLAAVDAAPKGHKNEVYDNLHRICGFPSADAMKQFCIRERKKLRGG